MKARPQQRSGSATAVQVGQKSHHLPARTQSRTLLWHERRRRRGWLCPGRSDDRHQLHFTGDFHAIGAAHNLLAAIVDNHIHWDNQLNIDPRRVTWRRVVDMNDRALRDITTGLGGPGNGIPRNPGSILPWRRKSWPFSVASDLEDLHRRIGKIVIAQTRKLNPHRQTIECGGRFDRAAAGRIPTQYRANSGKQPRVHAWRAICQYRSWLQFGHGHRDSAETGRLCRYRSRLWR